MAHHHRLQQGLQYLGSKLGLDRHETLKLLLSGITFFFVIASYSILRSLKTSIFLAFVGREYEPWAKIFSILVMVPAMLVYAKVIDRFKRHQTVYFFLGFYAVITLIFAGFFAHPVYGVANAVASPYRLVGWLFEIFMDLFQALIVGTFWSFVNSISSTSFASRSYGPIVACSRVGGILTTVLSWYLLEYTPLPETTTIPFLTGITAIFLLLAVYCVYLVQHLVPEAYLHGYEAGYKVEVTHERKHLRTGIFEGLRLMITQPYVMGIFALVFSFEIINIIFDYQMHILMSIETHNHVRAMSSFMLLYTGTFQSLSLLFAAFGTSRMIKRLGIKYCLMVMPVICIFLALMPVLYPKLITIFIVMVILRALNYGFNHPLREILFIPTVKDIQFKSKAWIESFGRTLSKTTGSTFNIFAAQAPYFAIILQSVFTISFAVMWGGIALLVGRKYLKTIDDGKVIGNAESR